MQHEHLVPRRVRRMLAAAVVSGSALIAVPQIAHADITPQTPSGSYNSEQTFVQQAGEDGITVAPESTFNVNASSGNAVSITGTGTITYDAENVDNTLTTTVGSGLSISSTGDSGGTAGSINVISNASITGGTNGIFSTNNGTGNVSITTDGDVTGTSTIGAGIGIGSSITNSSSAGSTIINAKSGAIKANGTGISATTSGTGGIDITTNGDVTGTTGPGISATLSGNSSTNDIVINAKSGDILGGNFGVSVANRGTGGINITTNGDVTGTSNTGIYSNISNSSSIGDTVIVANTGAIRGDIYGVYAATSGTGGIDITTDGDVTGTSTAGILTTISGTSSTNDIVINAKSGDILGGNFGVSASNRGMGGINITTNGDVTGTSNTGIYSNINNSSSAGGDTVIVANTGAITGGIYGVYAATSGTGGIDITTDGDVTGTTGTGISATLSGTSSTNNIVINAKSGDILGGNFGVDATNRGTGGINITTNGDVTGTSNTGIFSNISNSNSTGDTVIIANTGAIMGKSFGVNAITSGTGAINITTNGDVTGTGSIGINAEVDNINGGTVTVDAQNGDIYGGNIGIRAVNNGVGNINVTTKGNVTGDNLYGIFSAISNASSGGSTTINVLNTDANDAIVKGEEDGIYASSSQNDSDITVTTNGTIIGTTNTGIHIDSRSDGINTVNATGSVTGAQYGINVSTYSGGAGGAISITTNGDITGTRDTGIYANIDGSSDKDITIDAQSGSVTGGDHGIYAINDGTGGIDITSSSDVTGTAKNGIFAYARSNSTKELKITANSGTISGGGSAIYAQQYGTGDININTSGATVIGNTDDDITDGGEHGIYAFLGNTGSTGKVDITTADVSGGNDGIHAENDGAGDVIIDSSAGSVIGNGGAGINAYTSEGNISITAANATGYEGDGFNSGIGILARTDNGAGNIDIKVVNGGLVQGDDYGIYAENDGAGGIKIDSSAGTVESTFEDGISAEAYGDGLIDITTANVTGGGYGIYARNYGAGGVTIDSSAGTVIGEDGRGIYARTSEISTGDLSVTTGAVTGTDDNGIYARQDGTGKLTVIANGKVTSIDDQGIHAVISQSTSTNEINITTQDVQADADGIYAENDGTGNVFIDSSAGSVTGNDGDGIFAVTNGGNVTVTALNVTGLGNGNSYNDGIYAGTGDGDGDVTVTIAAGGTVHGDYDGIGAVNYGTGKITVDSSAGTVTSGTSDGIYAHGDADAGDIKVTTGDITAGDDGVLVSHYGVGDITIIAKGTVNALGDDGLDAQQSGTGGITIDSSLGSVIAHDKGIDATADVSSTGNIDITTANVTGGSNGIYAKDNGTGDIKIDSSAGSVTGNGGDGIYAQTSSGGIDITAANVKSIAGVASAGYGINAKANGGDGDIDIKVVNNGNVEGDAYGIFAMHYGLGGISINSTQGTVTGLGNDNSGIYAQTFASALGDIDIRTANVSGSDGILAFQYGEGGITIDTSAGTVEGLNRYGIYAWIDQGAKDLIVTTADVSGGEYAVVAGNNGTGNTSVTANGEVQGDDAAIYASANAQINLTIGADGNVHNTSDNLADLAIQFEGNQGNEATIINNGIITGSVDLGDENDTLTNTGTIQAAVAGTTSSTIYSGLEKIIDSGDINMHNGIAGDNITFTNGGNGIYETAGSHSILVDADIVTGIADELHVDNAYTGSAPNGVNVNIVNGLGAPITGTGIKIVDVLNHSDPDAFVLDHPMTGGLYQYLLGQDASNSSDPDWYLTSGVRPEAVAANMLSVLGSRTALSTLSNVHDRQRDAKVLSDNNNPHKGVWARVFGNSEEFNAKDVNDFGYKAHTWGAQAGVDLLAKDNGKGAREYAGLYVAYADASGDARQHNSNIAKLDLNVTTVGAYYTKYTPQNWYVDLTGQYSWLSSVHAKTANNDLSPNGSSYALSGEVGQQFGLHSAIVREVQAQLIYQNTDVNDVTLSDATQLHLSPVNAVTGRFGVRLYGNAKSGKNFLPWARANVWHTFSKDASISSLGNSISTPIGGTSGELELGFTNGSPKSGWSFYGSAGYLFNLGGAEYSGWKGTLGLRKGW